MIRVDHLVVGARTIEEGVAWCEATLGVTPGPGGRHTLMGTHNRLLAVGSAAFPEAYFEIIAIDPEAPAPGRARWFGLDTADFSAGPRLVHVVARTTALDVLRQGLLDAGLQPGEPIAASRGDLSWTILVRPDGTLPCGGALPTLIQWHGRHPAAAMPACGLALKSLALRGVPDAARALLQLQGVDVSSAASPALTAVLTGPRGDVTLESA